MQIMCVSLTDLPIVIEKDAKKKNNGHNGYNISSIKLFNHQRDVNKKNISKENEKQ
jgi:hypothetical protein